MGLIKIDNLLNIAVRRLSHWANSVGIIILALMMFLTAMDVFLRFAFNRPILGSYEITEYMMAIVIPLGLAYCAVEKGHVGVDLVISKLPHKARAGVSCITNLLGFGLFSLITMQSIDYISIVIDSRLVSSVLLIPRFPFAAMITIGIALYCLVMLTDFLQSLLKVIRK